MRATRERGIAKLTQLHQAGAPPAARREKSGKKDLDASKRPPKDYTGESHTGRVATRSQRAAGATLRAHGHEAPARASDIQTFLDRRGVAHDVTRDGIVAGLSQLSSEARTAFIAWFESLSDTDQHRAMVQMRSDALEDRRIVANPTDFVRSLGVYYKPVPPRWRELAADPMAHETVRESVNAVAADMAAHGVVGALHETPAERRDALADAIRHEFIQGMKLLDTCLQGEIYEAFERWPMHTRQELVRTFVMPFEGNVDPRHYGPQHADELTRRMRAKLDQSSELRAFEAATRWYDSSGSGTKDNAANDAAVLSAACDVVHNETSLQTYPHSLHTKQVLTYFWETRSKDPRIDEALRAIAAWPPTLSFDRRQCDAELALMRRGHPVPTERIAKQLGERDGRTVRMLAEIHCDGNGSVTSALTDIIRTRVAADSEYDTFLATFMTLPACRRYFRDADIHGAAVDAVLRTHASRGL